MPSSPQTSSGTAGSILLVEEYGALAIAFSSALKKFAPEYETRVVASLQQAASALTEFRPNLFVLDCDPPPRGALHFFKLLRATVPDARVLVIAAENGDDQITDELRDATLQFIKKPFDLAVFGQRIRALLARGKESRGTARDFKLSDLVLFYAITASNIALKVETNDRSGEIHFGDGRIVHAAVLGRAGVEALREIFRWRARRLTESERPIDAPRSISGAWPGVLRDALHASRSAQPLPREEPAPTPAPAPVVAEAERPAKKILVVDDTELLLIFLEEILATGHPEIEIVTALSGSDGVKCAAAVKPDLILLDYSLPDLTGAAVCEQLLANDETARIPVLMMSGHVGEMTAAAEEFENVVGTIAKPFLSDALIELVERTLRDPPQVPRRRKKRAPRRDDISPNGASTGGNSQPSAPEPVVEAPPPPAPEVEAKEEAESEAPSGLAEETLPTSIIEEPEVAPMSAVPTTMRSARLHAVVLRLPLEVIALQLSPALRVTEIRARPFTSSVLLHALPEAAPGAPATPESMFQLGAIELNAGGGIKTVRVEPMSAPSAAQWRYRLAIDGLAMSPDASGQRLQLNPTVVGPMRFELLALFQPAAVDLSAAFTVQHLVLAARDERMRATLLPEAAHVGATFRAAEVHLNAASSLTELRLVAI